MLSATVLPRDRAGQGYMELQYSSMPSITGMGYNGCFEGAMA